MELWRPPLLSSPSLLMTALRNTCWGEMTWIIMTTNDFPFSSGEGAYMGSKWKLHPFSVPGSLDTEISTKKVSVKITKSHMTFWKLMKNIVNPRESRRPDMRSQDKRLNESQLSTMRTEPHPGWQPSLCVFWEWSEKSALNRPYYLYLSWLTEMLWQNS